MALNNTLSAIQSGVNWCDSTIMGMGHGAGNVNTEALMLECVNQGLHAGNPSLLNVCREYFEPLMRKYYWGANHNIILPLFTKYLNLCAISYK